MADIVTRAFPVPLSETYVVKYQVRCQWCRRPLQRWFSSNEKAIITAQHRLGWEDIRGELVCLVCIKRLRARQRRAA